MIPVCDVDITILGDNVHRIVHDRNWNIWVDTRYAREGLLNEKDLDIVKQNHQNGGTHEHEAPKFDSTVFKKCNKKEKQSNMAIKLFARVLEKRSTTTIRVQ
jgi:hypothetical protein